MKINEKIKPLSEYLTPDRTDATGKCFMLEDDGGTHYYRQDRNRVLHVNTVEGVLINELPDNYLESARQNWNEDFEAISEKEFESILQNTLSKLYEV